jgi:anti-anti-sigma regulatory factor
MSIENWSEGVVLVDLPGEAELEGELQQVAALVRDQPDYDVVLDFSNVSILSPRCLIILLQIRKELQICGHRLVLSSLVATTWGILSATGLAGLFEITCDRCDALATVQAHP